MRVSDVSDGKTDARVPADKDVNVVTGDTATVERENENDGGDGSDQQLVTDVSASPLSLSTSTLSADAAPFNPLTSSISQSPTNSSATSADSVAVTAATVAPSSNIAGVAATTVSGVQRTSNGSVSRGVSRGDRRATRRRLQLLSTHAQLQKQTALADANAQNSGNKS